MKKQPNNNKAHQDEFWRHTSKTIFGSTQAISRATKRAIAAFNCQLEQPLQGTDLFGNCGGSIAAIEAYLDEALAVFMPDVTVIDIANYINELSHRRIILKIRVLSDLSSGAAQAVFQKLTQLHRTYFEMVHPQFSGQLSTLFFGLAFVSVAQCLLFPTPICIVIEQIVRVLLTIM